jgi:hypothetical protein
MVPSLAAALLLAAAAPATAEAAEAARPGDGGWRIREEVVALVRGPGAAQPRALTLTRLEDEARIALVSRGATAAADAPLDREVLRAALDWLVDQTLLGDEATRLQVIDVEPAEVEAELRRFQERFADAAAYRAFLDRLELPEEELDAILHRTLRVARYVESRTAAGDAEGTARRVRALVADLRARSEVRILDRLEWLAP